MEIQLRAKFWPQGGYSFTVRSPEGLGFDLRGLKEKLV